MNIRTLELRHLEQFWSGDSHSAKDLWSCSIFVRFVLNESLQHDLKLLELLRNICRITAVLLTLSRIWYFEVTVIPVQSFPCQANLSHVRSFKLMVWISAQSILTIHHTLRTTVLLVAKPVNYSLRDGSWLVFDGPKALWIMNQWT